MPVFEFTCKGCGSNFEEFFFSSNNLKGVKCPKCSSFKVRKNFSVFGLSVSALSNSSSSSCGSCSSSSCNTCGR